MKHIEGQTNSDHYDHVDDLGWSARTYARYGFDHLDHLDHPFKLKSNKGKDKNANKYAHRGYIGLLENSGQGGRKPPKLYPAWFTADHSPGHNDRYTWSEVAKFNEYLQKIRTSNYLHATI